MYLNPKSSHFVTASFLSWLSSYGIEFALDLEELSHSWILFFLLPRCDILPLVLLQIFSLLLGHNSSYSVVAYAVCLCDQFAHIFCGPRSFSQQHALLVGLEIHDGKLFDYVLKPLKFRIEFDVIKKQTPNIICLTTIMVQFIVETKIWVPILFIVYVII